jgi:hypothetical protein
MRLTIACSSLRQRLAGFAHDRAHFLAVAKQLAREHLPARPAQDRHLRNAFDHQTKRAQQEVDDAKGAPPIRHNEFGCARKSILGSRSNRRKTKNDDGEKRRQSAT